MAERVRAFRGPLRRWRLRRIHRKRRPLSIKERSSLFGIIRFGAGVPKGGRRRKKNREAAVEPTHLNQEPSTSPNRVDHFTPTDQPQRVFEVASRLLDAYQVDGGTVHLAGCRMDDRLFLRFSVDESGRCVSFYLDEAGAQVDPAKVDCLGIANLKKLARPPVQCEELVARLAERGRRMVAQSFPPSAPPEKIEVVAIWCKFASGRLRFTIGEESLDLPFSGWSRLLEAPPVVCPVSGVETFHLAATDDGRIIAVEQIAACEETGRRVASEELVTCSVSGRRVIAERTHVCPVSGEPVLAELMVACSVCGEAVSPKAIEQGVCLACGRLEPVGRDDPRRVRLVEKYPSLGPWRKWQMAETASVWIVGLAGWTKRVRMVLDRETLEPKRVVVRPYLKGSWTPVEPKEINIQ